MRWWQAHIYTLKEAPADAEVPSHQLMMRAGLMRKLAPGIYTYGQVLLRAIRKFETIVRTELNKRGCTEILMPLVHPQSLWEETGRWSQMGPGLLKFKNRNEHGFCLAATHEEAVTDYFRQDLKSYRDLPRNLYQFQTKYRDEIRPRFGLMRGREFIMKDGYSFDVDREQALKTYRSMYEAYQAIFDKLGMDYRIVEADAGNIGGSQTHEFQLLAAVGEDGLMVSDSSDFAANIEVCPAIDFESELPSGVPTGPTEMLPMEKFATPGRKTIKDLESLLSIPAKQLVKTLFFAKKDGKNLAAREPFCVLLRGSDEVNPIKLKNTLGLENPPEMLNDAEVREVSGAAPGSCGPVGLKIPIFADTGLQGRKNMVMGANEDGFHLRNVNPERDFVIAKVFDLRLAREGDRDPKGQGRLRAVRGIEVGHVFYLGTKYSEAMNLRYLDPQGKMCPVDMGCYGIGITRTVQACLEQSHDADGIIWPRSIAPFHVHLCLLDPVDSQVAELGQRLESELEKFGFEVLVDDREERPGVKFKDADLLGFPLRIVIGKRGLAEKKVDVVERKGKAQHSLPPEAVLGFVQGFFK